ncbi:MFS transporter [Rhodobium gokarnense]|uniref:MFS family permease n=1 Tax=Rhodobium gokarnense TaxID=364296 RepID=A0ABT3HGQ1_9HYPH|nr:MFS transporter [Rhodobium gokarnense]MCW2309576.1 MFS family permease [Rhodobium gokarnense]
MFSVLANPIFRHLFLAQIVALLGTGLATVALALLAYDLAGDRAGTVLGTALAIRMLANVGIAPVAAAVAGLLPRRGLLVGLDLVRAAIAAFLPFVTEVWQVYLLIFALQSASASFTPAFQATIPDIVDDEASYTNALSLSRLAYDLENLISPVLAAALLTVMGFHFLFVGTAIGFLTSAALVVSVVLPAATAPATRSFYDRTLRGLRIYLATPRLRGLLAINLATAAAGAIVIVNTVVYVQGAFGLGDRETALALASFGTGSMLVAVLLPRLLARLSDRSVMLAGALLLFLSATLAVFLTGYAMLLVLWFAFGAGFSLAQVPSGRLLRRSAHQADRPAVFAAQFALSHACWLLTYPLAGWLGAGAGLSVAAGALAAVAAIGGLLAIRVWPGPDEDAPEHGHSDLAPDHPHLLEGDPAAPGRHRHPVVIDDLHAEWPTGR